MSADGSQRAISAPAEGPEIRLPTVPALGCIGLYYFAVTVDLAFEAQMSAMRVTQPGWRCNFALRRLPKLAPTGLAGLPPPDLAC